MKTTVYLLAILFLTACTSGKVQNIPAEELSYNLNGTGTALEISFRAGKAHNHPLMAIWAEDMEGNYLQTIYVAKSIGKGIFEHGDASTGKWMPGEIRRPAALPVWAHKRGIRADDGLFIPSVKNPVPDAYTGATPSGSFTMSVRMDNVQDKPFVLYFEINQTWDWNEYWTNNKYPDDSEYKTSCQPALVYKAEVDPGRKEEVVRFEVIGHSHYSGSDGKIYDTLNTLTTALNITEEITVKVK
jgi:hypothetical protein